MKYGLTEGQLQTILAILASYPDIEEAVLFGSRAIGTYKEASDIDIAIKGGKLAPRTVGAVTLQMEESYLPFFVDVVDYTRIDNPALIEHIDTKGISIYRQGWQEKTLNEVGFLQRGKSKHRPRYAFHLYGGRYPFIQTGEIRSARKYIREYEKTYSEAGLKQSKLWKKGTLCITIAANIAEIGILDFDACFPDSVIGFVPDESKANLDFVYYSLKHFQRDLKHRGEGSVQDNINLGTFNDMMFPMPELAEQEAIAGILSSLDDKIDLLHRQNKTLEAIAQTLFRHWFIENAGDFAKLPELVEINPRLSLKKGYIAPYLEMKNVQTDSCAPLDWYDREYKSGTRFQNGDTLMARITPCLENNKVSYVNFLNPNEIGWGSTEFLVLRAKGNLPKFYTYLLAKNPDFRSFAIKTMTGSSGRQRVQTKSLFEYELGIPSDENLQIFSSQVTSLEKKLKLNSTQIRTLEKLRDTLLPKLMSGEVRVRL